MGYCAAGHRCWRPVRPSAVPAPESGRPGSLPIHHRLHGIGDKHHLTVNRNGRAQQNAGIRFDIRRVVRQDKVIRRRWPSVRTVFCARTCAGASASDASDKVTVSTASGGRATLCRIEIVPDTLGCCCEEVSDAMPYGSGQPPYWLSWRCDYSRRRSKRLQRLKHLTYRQISLCSPFHPFTCRSMSCRLASSNIGIVDKCGTDLSSLPANDPLFRLLHPSDHLRFRLYLASIRTAQGSYH